MDLGKSGNFKKMVIGRKEGGIRCIKGLYEKVLGNKWLESVGRE